MRIGVTMGTNYSGVPTPQQFFRFIDRLEQLPFDSIWVGDHISWTFPHMEAVTALAMYAARTKRLTVGTAIMLLPLRHPVIAAKMLSLTSYLSEGRVVAGFGVGGENREEFEACGVPHHQRGRRMTESIEIMRRLWTKDHVSYRGKYFQLNDVSLDPKPTSLPIWLGGRSEAAHKRAAALADGWIALFSSPRYFAESKKAIEGFGAKPGFEWVQFEYMYVDKSREAAKAKALDYMNRTYNMDFGDRVERFASFGPGESIAERLREFQALGATHVIINPTCAHAEKDEQVELIASEVLPLLRSAED